MINIVVMVIFRKYLKFICVNIMIFSRMCQVSSFNRCLGQYKFILFLALTDVLGDKIHLDF